MKTKILLLSLALVFTAAAQPLIPYPRSLDPQGAEVMVLKTNRDGGMSVSRVPAAAMLQASLPADTNVVCAFSAYIAQGMASTADGATNYQADTGVIYLIDWTYTQLGNHATVSASSFTNGLPGWGGFHAGDPDFYDGVLYVPCEAAVNSGGVLGLTNIAVACWSQDLSARYSVISISNALPEASSVALSPNFSNNVTLFATTYAPSPATNLTIGKFTVSQKTNLTFNGYIPLSQTLPYLQGSVIGDDGLLYVFGDSDGGGARLWSVDTTNGQVKLVMRVASSGEAEGLDKRSGLLMVDNAAAQLIQGYNIFGRKFLASDKSILGSSVIGDLSKMGGKIGFNALPPGLYVTGDSAQGVADLHVNRAFYVPYVFSSLSYSTNAQVTPLATTPTSTLIPYSGQGMIWNSNKLSSTNDFYLSVNSNSVINTFHLVLKP